MKTKVFRALYGLYEFAFFTFVLGALLMIILEIIDLAKDDRTVIYSLSKVNEGKFVPSDSAKGMLVLAKNNTVTDAQVVPDRWDLTFQTSDVGIRFFTTATFFLAMLYVFVILYTLRKFIHSLKNNTVFTVDNIKRLQLLGVLILLIDPLRWIRGIIRGEWIQSYFHQLQSPESTPFTIGQKIGFSIGYTVGSAGIIFHWALTGLIILVIAQVFRQALVLKEEQEFTI